MIEYTEKYGADADGNRYEYRTYYELDNSDTYDIRQEIFNALREDEYDYFDTVIIQLINEIDDNEVSFEVEISEYITKQEFDKVQGE